MPRSFLPRPIGAQLRSSKASRTSIQAPSLTRHISSSPSQVSWTLSPQIPSPSPLSSRSFSSTITSPHPSTPPSSSPAHTTLATFLHHAARTSLSPNTPTYTGTLYEYLCLASLRRLGFSLSRVGGRGDAGIDLVGTWHLPSLPLGAPPLDVVVQCKALKLATGPVLVRELEGVLARKGGGTVGVLCARRKATKGVREAVAGARGAVVWLQVVVEEEGENWDGEAGVEGEVAEGEADSVKVPRARVVQMLWNSAVQQMGAKGMDVTTKRASQSGSGDGEVALLWKDEIWEAP